MYSLGSFCKQVSELQSLEKVKGCSTTYCNKICSKIKPNKPYLGTPKDLPMGLVQPVQLCINIVV